MFFHCISNISRWSNIFYFNSIYYSRELAANYFTYPTERGTHFVLFDDAETLRRKVRLAESYGIREAFVMYPEICDLLSPPEA